MTILTELHKEKERLQEYLEWGKDILHFDELNTVRDKIKALQLALDNSEKRKKKKE